MKHNYSIENTYYGFEPYRMVDISRQNFNQRGRSMGFYMPTPRDIDLAKKVIEREQPIRFDVLCRRLSPLFNLDSQRITDDLRNKTNRLISFIRPPVRNNKDFVYLSDMKHVQVRYRTNDAFHDRKTEDICYEEMMQALNNIGTKHSRITKEELIEYAVKAFGYLRKGADLCNKLQSALSCMIARKDVTDFGSFLFFSDHHNYRMGDYTVRVINSTLPRGQKLKFQTAAVAANTSSHPCYLSVGDISAADKDGFLRIEIKKELISNMRKQKRAFSFKVTEGENKYLYTIGSKKLYNAVYNKGKYFSASDMKAMAVFLNVNDGCLLSIGGDPRINIGKCNRSKTKKNIPDSPEAFGSVRRGDYFI